MDGAALLFLALLVGIPVALMVAYNAHAAKVRREEIYRSYGKTEIAERIISKTIWVGETERQLQDSLGRPHDTDQKVLKTKSKVIWKYHHRGGSRYGLRITVENGLVVGWDEKL